MFWMLVFNRKYLYLLNPRMKDCSPKIILLFYLPVLIITGMGYAGCNKYYHPETIQYQQIRISEPSKKDMAVEHMLHPYAENVNRSMSKVIGEVAHPLEKKLPECTLGNLMADAMKVEAEKIYGLKVDAAFINYGGIRISHVPAGKLTLNQVFEMMPFDNQLVVQKLPGIIFQQFLDTIAKRGGWPGSGIQYVISNRKATQVLIGGIPLDPLKEYTIANSDYVVNGGDNCTMLGQFPQENKGFLVRDGLIEYFSDITARGEKISAQLENRVKNAD